MSSKTDAEMLLDGGATCWLCCRDKRDDSASTVAGIDENGDVSSACDYHASAIKKVLARRVK